MNIFENMSQAENDRLCKDEGIRRLLDSESERIDRARIEKVFKTAEWMMPYQFKEYLMAELKKIYKKKYVISVHLTCQNTDLKALV